MNNKICILSSVHPAFDTRIFYKQTKTLVKAGYDVTLIAQHDKDETVDGVKIIALYKPKNRLQRMLGLTPKVLSLSLKQNAEVYHFHDPELIPVGTILKTLGKKVIYDVHEDYNKQILSKSYLPKITRNSIALITKAIENTASKFFDGIITATDNIQKNFSSHNKAISVRNFPILSPSFSVKKFSDNDIFNLIYVGILFEIKGITQIIKALELVDSNKPLKLTMCGEFIQPEYMEKVRSLKGFEKVEHLGWVDSHAIPDLLRKADAGIVCFLPEPNYIKSMPIKLFEYMEASLPIIASNFPLWKKIVEGNKCGVCVDPLKPKNIAEAIEYLMEQPVLRKKMGKNGRQAVLEKYNWEKEAIKLLAVYENLIVEKTKRINE